jgi:hypothetical protein
MKYFFRLLPLLLIAFVARAWGADAATPAAGSLFDPARHMHVSEVQPGMEGYGLTVFKGTKIEKFGCHVVSVLHNFNPRYDVVLIKCDGEFLEHTGSIAGMSGSPVFLKDDSGHYRMIGAFAYGWPLTKDPVAGVQPIEYMLALPTAHLHGSGTGAATQPSGTVSSSPGQAGPGTITWSVRDAGLPPRLTGRHVRSIGEVAAIRASTGLTGDGDDVPQMQPLTTPIMTSGLSKSLLNSLAPQWSALGMTALQAGGAGSVVPGVADAADAKLEPGGVLAVPLLTGDVEMTAIGTCTEVLGDRVWGFGHPFNNEGPIALPLGTGYINGVIANLETSFKLGSLTKCVGTLNTDASVGVAGLTGHSPKMIPIEFTVTPADGSPAHTYHFQSVSHRKFTPMLAATAFSAAVTGSSEPPEHNTLDYDLKIDFANGQTLEIADTAVEAQLSDLAEELTGPMTAAADNPFEQVSVVKITGKVTVSPVERLAQIMEVTVPKSRVLPGETVKAFVRYQPYRAAEAIMPVELTLPRNIPEGQYQLVISDDQRFFEDEQQAKPFMFTAQRIGDVFAVLKDLAAIRSNAIYLRLIRQPDGVAIGRTAMADLPSSMRTVLMGAGRSTITPFVSSTVKVVPTEMVIKGAAEFTLTVDNNAKLAAARNK